MTSNEHSYQKYMQVPGIPMMNQHFLLDMPEESTIAHCPKCLKNVQTCTSKRFGTGSLCLCSLLTMCGLCALILCIDKGKDVVHECPECKTVIGKYRPFAKGLTGWM